MIEKAIYLEDISEENIKKFTEYIIHSYSTQWNNNDEMERRLEHANIAIDILYTILEEKGIFWREKKPYLSWVNILICAVYTHYCVKWIEPDHYTELFDIRQECENAAAERGINKATFDVLCQTIEATMGDRGVPNCKPVPGTPTELMYLAIFFEQRILPRLNEPEID